jgi:hypothetical protein
MRRRYKKYVATEMSQGQLLKLVSQELEQMAGKYHPEGDVQAVWAFLKQRGIHLPMEEIGMNIDIIRSLAPRSDT